MSRERPGWQLRRWLLGGEWRAHPVRALVAIVAIALGVALGYAVHLINAAAFNEFSAAVKSLSGAADLQVRGAQSTFDEMLYPALAQRPGVEQASPVLELDAAVPGQKSALKILGVDVLRAAAITPDLVGVSAADRPADMLADDAIFLSPAALEWLGLKSGDRLQLQAGAALVTLRVAGAIARARPGQRIALMDLGAAQWRFGRLGQLSRIDLKLAPGINRDAFRAALAAQLGPTLLVAASEDQEARTANLSRAYRVNLTVLALVALFTGAFLVFSTQALSVIRRRPQFAMLRVLGLTRRQLLSQVLLEGGLLGVLGSLLGLALGLGLAALALRLFGGDLGGGYFPGVQPGVHFDPLAAAVFLAAGSLIAMLGSASPAWEAARARPAPALKAGSEDVALARLAPPWPALACLAAGALATQLPPLAGLPIFGYCAVALLLIGAIALMPRLAALAFGALARYARGPVSTLALARLANAPNLASIALGGVLSSFSLMVAMAIMVASFRVSVDDWLLRLLQADLYVRAAASGNTATLGPREQEKIAALPGVARVDFSRFSQLALDPARPAVTVIARPIDLADPGKTVPLTGDLLAADRLPPGLMPLWASEAMVDLYGYALGSRVTLPLGKERVSGGISGEISRQQFMVAGIWRDYARQTGAVQIRLADYRALTGDQQVNDAALWLQPGVSAEQASAALRKLPFGDRLTFSLPSEIRAQSLKIFDRSFAVTYLLEAVAIVIGLFGIAATFSAQALARSREFGMLRHVGVTRRQILAVLGTEGGLLCAIGIAAGFALGFAISLILVFIVNPQSFHWTMRLTMPWGLLGSVAALLLASAALTALVAGRHAVSGSAVRAVREDW
jgi:putative ABC transport system permease protein